MKHVVVIGAGHAGCEAALAAARLGASVSVYALSLDAIANMPCNPCIGGSAKGHLVREIDALGGEMGRAIDHTFIQSRMLNTSKGPAVYSLRAQADKKSYMQYMKSALENERNISLFEEEITEIVVADGAVVGVVPESGCIKCDSVVVAAGTYLKSRCLYGDTIKNTGPGGLRNSTKLSACLEGLGFALRRFKTGTPARVHRRSLDFDKMQTQNGDKKIVPFSFETDPYSIGKAQVPCYLTYTTPATHNIILKNAHKSSMYSGLIEATGTRYCPSIEDKVVRFADKERHQIFIEPEGLGTCEMYVQGMSSALPLDVQKEVYNSVPGLERCEIMRPAYAIEYDVIDSSLLKSNLEAKTVRGLFFAGQINGSSGYEEAAAQGLVAGIACVLGDVSVSRSDGYIGVLIDDLVTKGTNEPYRMMTSRAEYRLLLRQDNADLRLTPKGYKYGLISKARYDRFCKKKKAIDNLVAFLEKKVLNPEEANAVIRSRGGSEVKSGVRVSDLIKRPELSIYDFVDFVVPKSVAWDGAFAAPEATVGGDNVSKQRTDMENTLCFDGLVDFVRDAVFEQANIRIKYSGYIELQLKQVEEFIKMESRLIPDGIDYTVIKNLRLEARQKLTKVKPQNFGQAARVTGVSPADISVLMVYVRS